MRILHVVTLVGEDGAYGGPLRVALNQVTELRRRGHDVHIAAGWRGRDPMPDCLEGASAHLFAVRSLVPPLGFSGLISPALFWWLARRVRVYDLVHVHAGRDLISLAAMALAGLRRVPYVTQTHGMVTVDLRPLTRMVDAMGARRLFRRARIRFVLTPREEEDLSSALHSHAGMFRLINGVPAAPERAHRPGGRQVLFCARMQERKRPVAFVHLAAELVRRGVTASYRMVGPDEGELDEVLRQIAALHLTDVVVYEGALGYGSVLERMADADVYVLPSVDEPFPMSLLEALSLGIPSVFTDSCGIADPLRVAQAALVTDESVSAMADAVETLLGDHAVASEVGLNARRVMTEQFSMFEVGRQLENQYLSVLART